MNSVMLMGRFTKEIELREAKTPFAIFTIAVDRRYSKEKESDFINCKAFGKTAENMAKFFTKGDLVVVEGRIQTGSYEKEGKKVYTTDVIVDNFNFTASKKKAVEETAKPTEAVTVPVKEEDLPF
jgi:single-strand DNA-binding protein